jgi:hypothetical protein
MPGPRSNRELFDVATSALREAEEVALAQIGRGSQDRQRARRRLQRAAAQRRWRRITSGLTRTHEAVTPEELADSYPFTQAASGYTTNHTKSEDDVGVQ